MTLRLLALLPLLLGFSQTALPQQSERQRDERVEAMLVGENTHIQPGQPYRVGLLLQHDPGWHTYWKSTATGYATSIDWDLPNGFSASDIQWPTPKTYGLDGFVEFVYEGETLLIVTLTPPAELEQDFVTIGFEADWLMCEAVCIPGSVRGTLRLPVDRDGASAPGPWASLFTRTDATMPQAPGPYSIEATQGDDAVQIRITGPELPDDVYFFNDQALLLAEEKAQPVQASQDSIMLSLKMDPAADSVPDRLTGVLRADPGWPALNGAAGMLVDIPLHSGTVTAGSEPVSPRLGLGMLLLAFAGGLILNLMPCVFPVLGIKIMGFVSQGGQSRSRIAAHGLVFSAGVLISFWILAGVLIALRAGGQQLGWGFQLQEPGFVLALTFLLLAFGLNMSGIFEVGQSAIGVGGQLTAKNGMGGSFFSGVLATLVATPCAAPFLAPALGAAMALPPLASLLVFTLIALGLATPYLTLSVFPDLLRWLPRPGAWMETFKQGMAFLLYATVAYLLWVLAGQLNESAGYPSTSLLKVLLALVLLAVALWVYGRWTALHRPARVRLAGLVVAILIGGSALYTGFRATAEPALAGRAIVWESWEPGKAEALAAGGKTVYVDFTARWCVTCQTNKAAVFSSDRVLDLIDDKGVVLLKADWTQQDPRISQALEEFGRSAVPFNLVYGPGLDEPAILPEILTPALVLEALAKASQ